MDEIAHKLERKGVKPTANRMLVYQALVDQHRPLSMRDLEMQLLTLDKSSIFRVLTLFAEHDVVHAVEDGRGIELYELCHHEDESDHMSSHVHFYCEKCQRTYCIEEMALPAIQLPEGYHAHSMSFMVKGECPQCNKNKVR
jgi:Fur family ferric uptake transcriptional regulator